MSYFQKCETLKENPVSVPRHFQNRIEVFFTETFMGSDLLGEIKYFAIRVEFQFRGSPHILFFGYWGKLNIMQLESSFNSVAHHIFIFSLDIESSEIKEGDN